MRMVRCRILKPSFLAKSWIAFSTFLLMYYFTSVLVPPLAACRAAVPITSAGATPMA